MRCFLKAWVVAVVALVTAFSFGLITFNFIPKAPWSLVALVTFIIFAIIIIAGIINRDREIARLKSARPSILVDPIGFSLRVRNMGAFATFAVNIRIIKENKQLVDGQQFYSGWWQKTQTHKAAIMKADYDDIVIAEAFALSSHPDAKVVRLYSWDFGSSSKKFFLETRGDELEIEVNISSKPEMPEIKTRWYLLNLNGLTQIDEAKLM